MTMVKLYANRKITRFFLLLRNILRVLKLIIHRITKNVPQ